MDHLIAQGRGYIHLVVQRCIDSTITTTPWLRNIQNKKQESIKAARKALYETDAEGTSGTIGAIGTAERNRS
jgi:hypothetical protein